MQGFYFSGQVDVFHRRNNPKKIQHAHEFYCSIEHITSAFGENLYILKRILLSLFGSLMLFHLGIGLWKEVQEIRVTQQYEINEKLSHVTGLFVLRNAVIDSSLGMGESYYSVDTIQTKGNHDHSVYVHTTEERAVILVPLVEKTSNDVFVVRAWLAKTARDEREMENIKKDIYQGLLWSDHEIVETTQSRTQEELSFQFVPIRTLRQILRKLARSKRDKKRTNSAVSAAKIARFRMCSRGLHDDTPCPNYAPILFQGRRHHRFLGLGTHMWITSFLSFLTIGFLIGRTK